MKLGLYRHTNGNLYRVIGVARHSETLEEMIAYQALYHDYGLWVRPRAMFEEMVEKDGKQVPRFTFVSECCHEAPVLR